jgi:cardiolipin synthase
VDLINNAKKSIKIVTPYFLPPEEIINALVLANIKGVEVQIILPSKRDDHDFILLMNRNSYSKFYLSEKFKIYEYCGFIHSKLLIIDDEVLYTGSSNIDYRSLIINFEDSMIIKSKDVVRRTKVLFDEFIDCSKNVIYEKRVLSFANKVKIAMMNMYKPLL